MSNPIEFETVNFRWLVQLERQEHHTTATVRGLPHADARPVGAGAPRGQPAAAPTEPGRHPEFTVSGSNQDDLFEQIRATIVGLDGPITRGEPDDDSEG